MRQLQEKLSTLSGYKDFTRRKRHGSIIVIGVLFLIAIGVLIYGHPHREFFGGDTGFFAVIILLFGGLTAAALCGLQRNLDLITEVEFHNALFSSALTRHLAFLMFVRHDGNVVFMDQGLKEMFPGLAARSSRGLDDLAEVAGLAKSDRERLYDAIAHNRQEQFMFPLTDEEGAVRSMLLSVHPLRRPKGFFLIQGRDYVERSLDVSTRPDRPDPTEIYTRHLLDGMPLGAYVASPSGLIRLTNQALEKVLGYRAGEIVKRGMAVRDLLYQEDGKNREGFGTRDYHGDILFAHKNGSLVKIHLLQDISCDKEGNIVAVIGLVEMIET